MTETTSLSSDAFQLLDNQRRRYVLRCLTGRESAMALADLAADIAALENETTAIDVAPEAVKRVTVSLYHRHIPKLVAGDVVDYRPDRNVVSLAEENDRTKLAAEMAEMDANYS